MTKSFAEYQSRRLCPKTHALRHCRRHCHSAASEVNRSGARVGGSFYLTPICICPQNSSGTQPACVVLYALEEIFFRQAPERLIILHSQRPAAVGQANCLLFVATTIIRRPKFGQSLPGRAAQSRAARSRRGGGNLGRSRSSASARVLGRHAVPPPWCGPLLCPPPSCVVNTGQSGQARPSSPGSEPGQCAAASTRRRAWLLPAPSTGAEWWTTSYSFGVSAAAAGSRIQRLTRRRCSS